MIQLRTGIFETNSSSSHSLVIRRTREDEHVLTHDEIIRDIDYSIENGVLYIGEYDGLYFGRAPFRVLHDFLDKVRYAYASFYYEDKAAVVSETVHELLPEITRISLFRNSYEEERWQERKRDYEARKKTNRAKEYEDPEWEIRVGVDDHDLISWMDLYGFSLKEFFTDPRYVVICDGDEYCIWYDMVKLGIAGGPLVIADGIFDEEEIK